MRKLFLIVLSALLLTACGAPVEEIIAENEAPQTVLPGLDAAALQTSMPAEDYAAFAAYLPVLAGEQTFRWVAGPYDGYPDYDWEAFDTDMAGFRARLWSRADVESPPETLTLDRLAVQDVDGDGGAELVLLFRDLGYQYLVLHMEGETCYGTTFGVRWFMGLRKSGIYEGSGGAGSSTYYRMTFADGVFRAQELGSREEQDNEYILDGAAVSREVFAAWEAENLTEEVLWYAPEGDMLPPGT